MGQYGDLPARLLPTKAAIFHRRVQPAARLRAHHELQGRRVQEPASALRSLLSRWKAGAPLQLAATRIVCGHCSGASRSPSTSISRSTALYERMRRHEPLVRPCGWLLRERQPVHRGASGLQASLDLVDKSTSRSQGAKARELPGRLSRGSFSQGVSSRAEGRAADTFEHFEQRRSRQIYWPNAQPT